MFFQYFINNKTTRNRSLRALFSQGSMNYDCIEIIQIYLIPVFHFWDMNTEMRK